MNDSFERLSRLPRLLLFLLLAAALGLPGSAAAAKPEPGDPWESFTGFFRLKESIPTPLRESLQAYQEGRFFAALGSLHPILSERKPAYAVDDAYFLRALSLIGLGWDELAVPTLTSLLDGKSPAPYYVPALRELIEIHDRAGRWKAIADAWERYVDRPLRSGGARNGQIVDLLYEFGALRPPIPGLTRKEKSRLSNPKELAVILEKRRERSSDRLLYRSGLALFRLGRHQESLRALRMIGIESPYYPYARYSIAQDLFALGKSDDAVQTLVRLERYPKITEEERALGNRSLVLQAAILFKTGEVEKGIRVARSIPENDPEAPAAQLLITTALLDAGKPSLALAYDRAAAPPIVEADARHALATGAAYASLGDTTSAARVLRGAAGRLRKAQVSGPALDDAIHRLRSFAQASLREQRERDQQVRAHVAEGIHIVLAHDGPWNLGTLLRRARAALGAGAYRELALGTKPQPATTPSNEGAWLTYVASPRRATIDQILNRLADVEIEPGGSEPEASLRILNGYLLCLEQAPIDEESRRRVARRVASFVDQIRSQSGLEIPALELAPTASVSVETANYRRRLSEALGTAREPQPEMGRRDEVASLLRTWVERELRELLDKREQELHDLEFQLDVALAGTLGEGTRSTRPAAGE